MTENKFSLLNWPGNKLRLFDNLFPLFDKTKENYIELFAGSFSMYLNIPEDTYKQYILNDIIPYAVDFFNWSCKCKNIPQSQEKILNYANKIYENVNLKNKDEYYKFRNEWNEKIKNYNESNNLKLSIEFILIANACINNLVRFGPNGFNQSYGNRCVKIEKFQKVFNYIKNNSLFYKEDFYDCYSKLKNEIEISKSFFYIDCPYSADGMTQDHYNNSKKGKWREKNIEQLFEMCEEINDFGGTFCISNVRENEVMVNLFKDKYSIINIEGVNYQSSPNKNNKRNWQEIIIKNY